MVSRQIDAQFWCFRGIRSNHNYNETLRISYTDITYLLFMRFRWVLLFKWIPSIANI